MNNMVVKRNPSRNLDIWKDFDRIFDTFFNGEQSMTEVRTPVTEVKETETGFELTVEFPGFSTKELEVKVEENILSIKAARKAEKEKKEKNVVRQERRDTSFEKTFVLPKDIDTAKIEADLKNGLLKMTLPRKEKSAPVSIEVKG